MTLTEMIARMIEAGAPSAAVAVAVEAVEAFRSLPETSGTVTNYELAVWRKVERARKNGKPRKQRKKGTTAKANDVAARAEIPPEPVPEVSGNDKKHCDVFTPLSSNAEEEKGLSREERIPENEGDTRARAKAARGTRLTAESQISETDRAFAVDSGVTDVDALWAEFVDYWIGVPGQRGTKLDWSATWRNRVRMVGQRGRTNGNGSGAARYGNGSQRRGAREDAFLAGMARAAGYDTRGGDVSGRADAEIPPGRHELDL